MQYANLFLISVALVFPYGAADICQNRGYVLPAPRVRGQGKQVWIVSHAIYNESARGPCTPKTARAECGIIAHASTPGNPSILKTASYHNSGVISVVDQEYTLDTSHNRFVFSIDEQQTSVSGGLQDINFLDNAFAMVYDDGDENNESTAAAYVDCDNDVGWVMYLYGKPKPSASEITQIGNIFRQNGVTGTLRVMDTTDNNVLQYLL